ncbi:MAG TPA: hypothetical protein DER32_02890 [Deinococcus radiodurans]|nr:hypothetical protein DXG80_14710 [Deinococcus radiodurans]HCE64070.1 hypothetical protein [Deinococcus radiodurans]
MQGPLLRSFTSLPLVEGQQHTISPSNALSPLNHKKAHPGDKAEVRCCCECPAKKPYSLRYFGSMICSCPPSSSFSALNAAALGTR